MTQAFTNIPRHVAIIMDGNGRWAKNEGRERIYGHKTGVNSVREVVKAATNIGVEYLTIYAFSTENWGRPTEEVEGLMQLLSYTIINELEPLQKEGVKLQFIGDIPAMPSSVRESIEKAKRTQVDDVKLNLVIALNYGSRQEITNAVKSIVEQGIKAEDITIETISENFQSSFLPDVDLMIRTSGEQRLSNFMLWQLSYSELYFTTVLWPEFNADEFYKAIEIYNQRDRRFGLTK